jgi:hypothetical protein
MMLWLGGRRRVRGGSRRHRARIAARRRVLATTGRSLSRAPSAIMDRWAVHNGIYVPNDIGVAQFGLALRDAVPPTTVIAAGWLGAPAYFTGFEAIDIFGKTDKHIARIEPTLPFRPGHNKEDLAYSVGTLRPDIVFIGLDRPDVEPYGYVRVREGIYVRRDEATSDWVAAVFPETARP